MAGDWDNFVYGPAKKDEKLTRESGGWDAFVTPPPPDKSSITGNQLSASIDRYQAGLYGVGEAVAGAVGAEDTSKWLAERRVENERQADIASERARAKGAVDQWKDVHGISDFGSYAKGLAIQSIPYAAEALAGGVLARGAMSGTRAALAAAEAAGDTAGVARAQRALNLGSGVGGVAASYPSAVGDVLSNQREQAGKTDLLAAAGLAVPYAALNAVGVEGALMKGSLFRNTVSLLDRPGGVGGALARTAATATGVGFKEGASETGQEMLNQLGRMSVDEKAQFFSEDAQERYKESFIGGATLGGFAGGAFGGWRRSTSDQPPNNEISDAIHQKTISSPPVTTGNIAPPVAPPVIDNVTAPLVSTPPAMAGGTTPVAQASQELTQAQFAEKQRQEQEQQQAQQALQQQAAREQTFSNLGAAYNPEGTGELNVFGQPVLGHAQINQFGNLVTAQMSQLPPHAHAITDAIVQANNETGGGLVSFKYNGQPISGAKALMKAFANVATKFQIGHVASVEEAAANLEKLSTTVKGNQLDQLNAIYQALTGKDTPGYIAAQQSEAEKGAKNGKLQLQTTTGLGTVPVEGSTGEAGIGGNGPVRPTEVQPVGAAGLGEGSLGLQTGQLPAGGVRTSAGADTDLRGGQPTPNTQVSEAPSEETQPTKPKAKLGVPVRVKAAGKQGAPSVQPTPAPAPKATQREEAKLSPAEELWNDMDDTDTPYASLTPALKQAWELAVETKQTSGLLQEEIANQANDRAQETKSERLTAGILQLVIQPYGKLDAVAAQKKREFFQAFWGGAKLDTLPAIAKQMDISIDQARKWHAEMPKFFEKNGQKIIAAAMHVAEAQGMTMRDLEQLLEGIEAKKQSTAATAAQTTGVEEDTGQSTSATEEPVESDTAGEEEFGQEATDLIGERGEEGPSFEPEVGEEAEAAPDLNIRTRKSLSVQEKFNAVDTNQARIVRLMNYLESIAGAQDNDKSFPASRVRAAETKYENALLDLTQLGNEDLHVLAYDLTQKGQEGEASVFVEELQNRLEAQKKIAVEQAKKQTNKSNKEKPNAVQVESTDEGDVRQPAGGGEEVGQANAEPKKPTRARKAKVEAKPVEEVKEVKTDAEKASDAWDVVVKDLPGAPTFMALTDEERETFIEYGENNWTRADVIAELKKLGAIQLTRPQLTDESNIIDVEARVINETVKPQVAKLAAPQIDRLEKHYGVGRDTAEFLTKVKEDIVLYATKGADAVAAAIRDIIRSMQAGVLSMAMIFNPTGISQIESFIVIPQETRTTTQVVQAQVPAEVKGMSNAGKQAYATLIPALKAKNYTKFITIADKPSGKVFVFKADGSLVMQKKALFGLAKGDLYKGNNDLPSNRVTPAGLFGIKVIDAAKGGSAAKTAGEYDFGKVFALEDPDAVVTFMHSVWLKESDAAKRAAALKNESAADSRYSFGCINLDKDMFRQMVSDYANEMDGSKLFVVPDVQSTVGDFLTGNVANDKLVREGVQPVTKTTTTPVKSATQTAGVDRTVTGKEEKMMFGKDSRAANPYTVSELTKDIKDFVRADIVGRKLLIVNSVADLLNSANEATQKVGAALAVEGAYGVAVDGRAYLVADRIEKGTGRAKFMHEVGAHLGLENLLPKNTYDRLIEQLNKWAESNADTDEVTLAARAKLRVLKANTAAEDINAEMLAYFIEEAVQAGIDPTASGKETGPLIAWFRTLWAAFKVAIRKLGFKPEALTAQDVVDLAFGAARLEMAGTFHGTAAAFRKFSHKFMGAGEGAQAYGWGSYLAQRVGIAKGYWKADVDRKASLTFDGVPIRAAFQQAKAAFEEGKGDPVQITAKYDALRVVLRTLRDPTISKNHLYFANLELERLAQNDNANGYNKQALKWFDDNLPKFKDSVPEGNLMRVDIAVDDADLLNWDERLANQFGIVTKLRNNMSPSLIEDLQEAVGDSLFDMTGEDLYRGLTHLEQTEGRISDEFKDVEDYNKRLANKDNKQIVSVYLDEIAGIPGLKFLDRESRANNLRVQWSPTYNAWQVRTRDGYVLHSTPDEAAANKWAADNRTERTRNIVVFNDKNIFRVGGEVAADRQRMRFGSNINAQGLPPVLRKPVTQATTSLLDAAKDVGVNRAVDVKRFMLAAGITEDVVNGAAKYMKSAKDYLAAQYARQGTRIEHEKSIQRIEEAFERLPTALQGTGANSVNAFIYDSTTEKKWGYVPSYNPNVKPDADLKARFDAMPADAQAVIRMVFDHGYKSLQLKKQAVKAAADKEFSQREQDAAGDQEQLNNIAAERRAWTAKYDRLMGIKNDMPYAYLGRYGDYVAVAKSETFVDAERLANQGDLDAAKWLEENQSDANHYIVEFAETQAEANNKAAVWKASGQYQHTYAAEKEVSEAYVGGSDLFMGITRLRNMITRRLKSGELSVADQDTLDALHKLTSDLYLATVAEASAHRTAMQRKNIAGADKDMMRNLATRGRADAHFLASLKHNSDVTDAISDMRDEAKADPANARPYLNELLKRYAKDINYKTPAPLAQALTRMGHTWFLSFNPAFYLQQMSQTYVLSLPYMAGRLGYHRSLRSINSAYKDVLSLVKGLNVNEHIDFEKAPLDVRNMLRRLVSMGKIDIGIDADAVVYANERTVMNNVTRKLNGVNNRIEAINRATAAIAAYRGYLQRYGANNTEAATQFAAETVSNTHGSYDGFNTPRILNSNVGRVIGQFKRFQIIQLSMLGKLLTTAFKGASAEERVIARRSLKYITTHMAVLGGALGVPFVTQLGNMLIKVFGADDEPDDLEYQLRQAIGDPALANLLLRGIPAYLGAESIGKKLAMENVASILPFTDVDLTSRSGAEKVLVGLMGPTAALSLKFADALGMIGQGELYKGMELALPSGFANAMKGYRIATEGVTMRNGDPVLSAEEISMVDAAFQAVGLPTNTITQRQYVQRVEKEFDKYYSDRAAEIKGAYVNASRDGDGPAMAQARDDWDALQDSRRKNGYTVQPKSELFRATIAAQKRVASVVKGVETTKANKRFVEQII